MIKRLNLDIFVEDNWDIVDYLNSCFDNKNKRTMIMWIYNLFDRNTTYLNKYPYLKRAIEYINKIT